MSNDGGSSFDAKFQRWVHNLSAGLANRSSAKASTGWKRTPVEYISALPGPSYNRLDFKDGSRAYVWLNNVDGIELFWMWEGVRHHFLRYDRTKWRQVSR